nr:tetratricopeptide repeat protein [uncultured Glaciecola sp.]
MLSRTFIYFLLVILVTACASPDGVRIDNIPMYGQPEAARLPALKKADEDFIKKVASKIPDRKEASKIWWAQAEKFMAQGNIDLAMRRYNQSWLIDPDNYQPYWGFARVSLEQGKTAEAIEFLSMAKGLIDDPFQEVALLADTGTAYTALAQTATEKNRYFSLANENFAASTELDPMYANSWRRWAFSLFEQGKYSEAWVKVKRARELNARPFPESFITALSHKKSET